MEEGLGPLRRAVMSETYNYFPCLENGKAEHGFSLCAQGLLIWQFASELSEIPPWWGLPFHCKRNKLTLVQSQGVQQEWTIICFHFRCWDEWAAKNCGIGGIDTSGNADPRWAGTLNPTRWLVFLGSTFQKANKIFWSLPFWIVSESFDISEFLPI